MTPNDLHDIENARKFSDSRILQVKRHAWLQQFQKSERDILTDETGDEYICLRCEDSRCLEARFLPDGLQRLGDVLPITSSGSLV